MVDLSDVPMPTNIAVDSTAGLEYNRLTKYIPHNCLRFAMWMARRISSGIAAE